MGMLSCSSVLYPTAICSKDSLGPPGGEAPREESVEGIVKVEGPSSLSSERLTSGITSDSDKVESELKKIGVGDEEREGMQGESSRDIDTGVNSTRRGRFLRDGVNYRNGSDKTDLTRLECLRREDLLLREDFFGM